MADKKRWTVLVYMAGDNDLDADAVEDVKEMLKVGTGPDVWLVVQVDRSRRAHTRRHVIPQKAGTSYEDALKAAQVLPEINTGDPKTLANFLAWGRAEFPADRLALVVWNHGWGWKPYDLEEAGRAAPGASLPDARIVSLEAPSRRTFRTLLPFRHALFRHPAPLRQALDIISYVGEDRHTGLPRADALDTLELARALSAGRGEGGEVDLLGFDACLMAGLEIGYELRRHARVLVASEEDEPLDGWPYHALVRELREAPEMRPEKLGTAIAKSYLRWATETEARGESETAYTHSAVRMSGLEDLARATARLGEGLTGALSKETLAVLALVQAVQRMPGDRQFADLGHFAKLVARHIKSKRVRSAAADVIDYLRNVVLHSGHVGTEVRRATGLTVYLPTDRKDFRAYRRSYSALSFLRDHPEWLLFIDALHAPEHQLPE
jgi:hypothetical protein